MTYVRNRFTDPANVVAAYDWAINHKEEDGAALQRQLERTTTTDGVGFVRQQGSASPQVLRFKGTILTQAQHDAMITYYNLCETQTIYFRDFQNDSFEVLITLFNPVRKYTIQNPRDPSIPFHYWTYDIEMEVINEL